MILAFKPTPATGPTKKGSVLKTEKSPFIFNFFTHNSYFKRPFSLRFILRDPVVVTFERKYQCVPGVMNIHES